MIEILFPDRADTDADKRLKAEVQSLAEWLACILDPDQSRRGEGPSQPPYSKSEDEFFYQLDSSNDWWMREAPGEPRKIRIYHRSSDPHQLSAVANVLVMLSFRLSRHATVTTDFHGSRREISRP